MSNKIVIKRNDGRDLVATDIMYRSVLATLIENIDMGIHIVNEDGATMFYNQTMADMEGLDIEEVLGKNILEIFPSLTPETSTLLTVLKTKEPMLNRVQNYVNSHGGKITTINSTIPIIESGEAFLESVWNSGGHVAETMERSRERIVGAIELAKNITKEKELSEKLQYLQQELALIDNEEPSGSGYTFQSLIGSDELFHKTVESARKAAKSASTVLIYGETGTGKELFAQSIHNGSSRRDKPLIAQNCAALPETLLEGILFGTMKGSFTGAINRPGLFEQANGGTLILDEINSMGMQLQAKLLRVLQEGYIRRVGGLSDIPVDVRIIATTNEEPMKIVETGNLRKDLYYRLNVISLNVPPLRKRISDLPALSEHFIKKFNKFLSKDVWYMSNEVKEAFLQYDWPGNVRELENLIEGAMNMIGTGHVLKPEHFPEPIYNRLFINRPIQLQLNSKEIELKGLDEILADIEKNLIMKAMNEHENNISRSAESLGIRRQTLQHKLKRYGI